MHTTSSRDLQIEQSLVRVRRALVDEKRAFHRRHNTVPIPTSSYASYNASSKEFFEKQIQVKSQCTDHDSVRFQRENVLVTDAGLTFFIPPCCYVRMRRHIPRERREKRAHRHNELCQVRRGEKRNAVNTPTPPSTTTRHTVSMKDVIQNPDPPCTCDVCLCATTPKAHTWG